MGFFEDLAEGMEQFAQEVHDLLDAPRRSRVDKAKAIAEPLGLRADAYARIGGELDGVPVRRFSHDHGGKNSTVWYTHTEFELRVPLPFMMLAREQNALDALAPFFGMEEIQLQHALDPKLWIRCDPGGEDTVRALLTHADVLPALERLDELELRIRLQKRCLTVLVRGHHLDMGDAGIAEGLTVAKALNKAMLDPWDALEQDPHIVRSDKGRGLEGHWKGVPVRVEYRDKSPSKTRIIGWLDNPLPADTEVARKGQIAKQGDMGDAILDRMLAATSGDMEALSSRLCSDEVRGPLLEILHAHKLSRLTHDRVQLIERGFMGIDLISHLDTVAELILALGGGRPTGGSAQVGPPTETDP